MWFKNIYFFAFTNAFEYNQAELEQALAEQVFYPCAATELKRIGWQQPYDKHSKLLAQPVGNNILLRMTSEEKLLPAQVVNEQLQEQTENVEQAQQRPLSRKEKQQLKEDIIFQLLPRAFTRAISTYGYISPTDNLIVINASSRAKAEDFLALLRKSLGSLPITSLSPEAAPDEVMTNWLVNNSLNGKFELGDSAELVALGDQPETIKVKNINLASDEVLQHVHAEKYVNKIALTFDGAISFDLADDLSLKRIRYDDVITEQNDDIDSDDALTRLDADYLLMINELNRLIHSVLALFDLTAEQPLNA